MPNNVAVTPNQVPADAPVRYQLDKQANSAGVGAEPGGSAQAIASDDPEAVHPHLRLPDERVRLGQDGRDVLACRAWPGP